MEIQEAKGFGVPPPPPLGERAQLELQPTLQLFLTCPGYTSGRQPPGCNLWRRRNIQRGAAENRQQPPRTEARPGGFRASTGERRGRWCALVFV